MMTDTTTLDTEKITPGDTMHQYATTTEVATALPPKRNWIIVLYDDNDPLINTLDTHLQLVYRRLGPQINRGYFGFKKITAPVRRAYEEDKSYEGRVAEHEKEREEYRKKLQGVIHLLKNQGFLLIPCVSNAFIELLDKERENDPHLRALFENPPFQIMPVLLRPTVGVSMTAEPLCAYQGTALEDACRHIADTLETVVRNYFGPELEEVKTAWDLLRSPGTIQISMPSLHPTNELLHCFVEQTSARIVDAQQQVQDERETRLQIEQNAQSELKAIQKSEDMLRSQVESLSQQIAAMRRENLLATFRRWFTTRNRKREKTSKA